MVEGCVFQKKASQELKIVLSNFHRHALHSKKLSLSHPVTGKLMSWKAELPDDMKELVNTLRKFDS